MARATLILAQRRRVWLAIALGAVLSIHYARALGLSFSNDDYIILDKLHYVSFWSLWVPHDLLSNYYRPWSREFHYWALSRVFGVEPLPFHLASWGLWFAAHLLFFSFLNRAVGPAVAAIATCLSATQAAWGTLLVWAAGSQDLWAINAGLLSLWAFAQRRTAIATLAFVVALLSKETVVTLPLIAALYCVIVQRERVRSVLLRTIAMLPALVLWAMLHPHIGGGYRPWGYMPQPVWPVLSSSLRQLVNLDVTPAPEGGWAGALLLGTFGAVALGGAALRSVRPVANPVEHEQDLASRMRLAVWGLLWAILGWAPLLVAGVRWHSYYALWGALGFWTAVAALLRRPWWAAVALVAVLALLRPARTATPQDDLGSEWYHRRAGKITGAIEADIRRAHPTLASHSRVFFALIPGGVGLVGGPGYSPPLKVWYADTTVRGYYYSHYRTRTAAW